MAFAGVCFDRRPMNTAGCIQQLWSRQLRSGMHAKSNLDARATRHGKCCKRPALLKEPQCSMQDTAIGRWGPEHASALQVYLKQSIKPPPVPGLSQPGQTPKSGASMKPSASSSSSSSEFPAFDSDYKSKPSGQQLLKLHSRPPCCFAFSSRHGECLLSDRGFWRT